MEESMLRAHSNIPPVWQTDGGRCEDDYGLRLLPVFPLYAYVTQDVSGCGTRIRKFTRIHLLLRLFAAVPKFSLETKTIQEKTILRLVSYDYACETTRSRARIHYSVTMVS